MEAASCLRFSGKASQRWHRFVWLLEDQGDLIRKGISRGMGQRGGTFYCVLTEIGQRGVLFIMPLQTQAHFVRLNIFFSTPFLPTSFSLPAFLSSCCMCSTWTTNVPLYPLDMMRSLFFNNGNKFISMHWTPLMSEWQFPITRMLPNRIQAASETQLSDLRLSCM